MISIMLTATEWAGVNDCLEGGDKIKAIKIVRDAERHRKAAGPNPLLPSSTALRTWAPGIGLKEAKEAVELLMAMSPAECPVRPGDAFPAHQADHLRLWRGRDRG